MDGDLAPLDRICKLAERYNALVFVDACHATGFVGPTGRGTPEHFGIGSERLLINSTLGKALGGASGGYSTGRRELIEMQRQRARPYLFSNALAPPIVGAAIEVFSMLTSGDARVDSLQEKARGFRGALRAAGFTVGGDEQHPIVPLMLGDAKVAADFAEALLHRGVYAVGFSYPVVPEGKARVRLQLSGAHTNEQIECAIAALIGVGKEMALIP